MLQHVNNEKRCIESSFLKKGKFWLQRKKPSTYYTKEIFTYPEQALPAVEADLLFWHERLKRDIPNVFKKDNDILKAGIVNLFSHHRSPKDMQSASSHLHAAQLLLK